MKSLIFFAISASVLLSAAAHADCDQSVADQNMSILATHEAKSLGASNIVEVHATYSTGSVFVREVMIVFDSLGGFGKQSFWLMTLSADKQTCKADFFESPEQETRL